MGQAVRGSARCLTGLDSASPRDPLLLAVDNGTQSVRALLFDLRGELVARSQVALDAYRSPQPGWHEHDVDAYWQALCRAFRQLWAQPGAEPARLAGVAVTTQRGTVVNLDRKGRPLRPAITWLDQRRTGDAPPIGPLWRAAFRVAGVAGTVRHLAGEAEINWIRAHQPEVWEATEKFLLLSGCLNWRLDGRFVDSSGSQVAYIPFDYGRLRWAAPRAWQWQALAVEPSMLPALAPPARAWAASPRRRRATPASRRACRCWRPPPTRPARRSAPAAARRTWPA